MTEMTYPSATAGLPDTLEGCRVRLAHLHSEIAAIRLQISTADLRRQANRQMLDADWFHRTKTALRLKTHGQPGVPAAPLTDAQVAAIAAILDEAALKIEKA